MYDHTVERCPICGGTEFRQTAVLWDALIEAWELSSEEVEYVNLQQGLQCTRCGANLRSMALAQALLKVWQGYGILQHFIHSPGIQECAVLEINEAGSLSAYLAYLPRHHLVTYPEFDMMDLPFADGSWDFVIHSDTLEHVPDPLKGLSECRRVLRPGGICLFTIPLIVGRLTRRRKGLTDSYHGSSANPRDFLVQTEYGADFWTETLQAGFSECRIFSFHFPAAQAIAAVC
jgi:SAM-dependent methyltransferase